MVGAYVVESRSGVAGGDDLDGCVLAINNHNSIWQLELRHAELAAAGDVQRSIVGQGDVGDWVLGSEADVDEEVFPFVVEVEDDGTTGQRPLGSVCCSGLVDVCTWGWIVSYFLVRCSEAEVPKLIFVSYYIYIFIYAWEYMFVLYICACAVLEN